MYFKETPIGNYSDNMPFRTLSRAVKLRVRTSKTSYRFYLCKFKTHSVAETPSSDFRLFYKRMRLVAGISTMDFVRCPTSAHKKHFQIIENSYPKGSGPSCLFSHRSSYRPYYNRLCWTNNLLWSDWRVSLITGQKCWFAVVVLTNDGDLNYPTGHISLNHKICWLQYFPWIYGQGFLVLCVISVFI